MKQLLTIILCILTVTAFAQKPSYGIIHGSIYQKNNQPISNANIILINKDTKRTISAISDTNGKFIFSNVPIDLYELQITFIGYQTLKTPLELTEKKRKISLDKLYLKEKSEVLEDVTVNGDESSIIQKKDRQIIMVGKDLNSSGGNALLVLQNAPSVDVNFQSGNISLRGNENVTILINGKVSNRSPSEILRQTPAALIKQIEIITSPSAKYNPEGMSGLINIVLKKNKNAGFNGSVLAGIEHSKNSRPTSSVSFNYSQGIINIYGDYNHDFGKQATIQGQERTDKYLLQNFDFLHDFNDYAFKIGTDIYLDKQHTFSVYTYHNRSKSTLFTNTTVEAENTNLFTANSSSYNQSESMYNLDYKHDFKDNEGSLELEINYTLFKNPEESLNRFPQDPNNRIYDYKNSIEDTRKSWQINLDFEKKLGDSLYFEAGLEYRSQLMYNNILTNQEIEVGSPSTVQPRGDTEFDYNRYIYSAYADFSKEFRKFDIQAGVRLEYFKVDGLFRNTQQSTDGSYADQIFSIYPSLSTSYQISEEQSLQFAYSRRVDRPALYQVTPIQEWVSPLTISEGNRNLIPQFTNSLELNYTKNFALGYFTLGAFYRNINDKIGRTITIDPIDQNKQIISFGNYNSAENYGFEFSSKYKLLKWWTLYPRFATYIQESLGVINNQNESIQNTFWRTVLHNSVKINKRFKTQFTLVHRGKSRNIQYTVEPYTMFNIAASYTILNDKGTLTIRGTDVFNGLNYKYLSDNPFPQNGFYNLEYDSVYLGFSYNFGNNKSKTRTRKDREKNETSGNLF